MTPIKTVDIEYISMKRGDTFTIWAQVNDYLATASTYECVQIEIRVTDKGIVEIFCDNCLLKNF